MFFVTGLPRSRTAWFAAYLSTGSAVCHHELLGQCTEKQTFYDEMELPNRGDADHGLYLTDFADRWPQARIVVIHRDIEEVYASLLTLGIDQRPMLEENLAAIESMIGLHVQYDEIDDRLEEICDYCYIPWNPTRARIFSKLNIQTTDLSGDPAALALWRKPVE